eukprot:scaffold27.g6011.t1
MGKHNGRARKSGLPVGSALVNRARREGRTGGATAHLHTTDADDGRGGNMQSVLESNDLDELMTMASLAGRDFSAEKGHGVVVLSTGAAVAPVDMERQEAERREAEERNRHRLRIPRRPAWTAQTTPEQLDEQERSSFYAWRRELAALEQDERVVLTPFEKNLEVWRQLWRVLERSDIVVQVVDARDPMTYRSEDLEAYARELHAAKASLLLLNKADLLPRELRSAWADYFDARGLDYAFWSATAGAEACSQDAAIAARASITHVPCHEDPRATVLGVEDLLALLEARASAAVQAAGTASGEGQETPSGTSRGGAGNRLMVGLTGYPNVGKSSTINALFGSKKTAVAATPGKTKHFQTLNISDRLCLCDCPGLVLPQYAHSKAEMVAAGVIPIDRLTDVRAPVDVVAQRCSRHQLEAVYGLHLPAEPSQPAGDPVGPAPAAHQAPSAAQLLRALAMARGWVGASGLPDETRAGRRILKDYVDGKLLFCKPLPDASPAVRAVAAAVAQHGTAAVVGSQAAASAGAPLAARQAAEQQQQQPQKHAANAAAISSQREGQATSDAAGPLHLDSADLDLLDSLDAMQLGPGSTGVKKAGQSTRAAHKFHKKPARSKGNRGQRGEQGGGAGTATAYDGAPLTMGKRGGLVRIPV